MLMLSSKVVTPVKTGVQCFCNHLKSLDSGFHRNDDSWAFLTFNEFVKYSVPGIHGIHPPEFTVIPNRVCDKNVGAIFLTETYPPFGKGGQGGFAIKA
jgi:hypothetical protein